MMLVCYCDCVTSLFRSTRSWCSWWRKGRRWCSSGMRDGTGSDSVSETTVTSELKTNPVHTVYFSQIYTKLPKAIWLNDMKGFFFVRTFAQDRASWQKKNSQIPIDIFWKYSDKSLRISKIVFVCVLFDSWCLQINIGNIYLPVNVSSMPPSFINCHIWPVKSRENVAVKASETFLELFPLSKMFAPPTCRHYFLKNV